MALITNVVSSYNFEGNSNDAVGGNNGTDTAISYSIGNGKVKQGAGFNGSSSKITLPTTSFPSGAGNRTLSLWFNPAAQPSLNTAMTLFCYGVETNNLGFIINYEDISGVKKVTFDNYGTPLQTSQTLSNSTFYNVIVTYDGTTITVYVNGVSIASAARTLNTTATAGRVGCFYDAGANNKTNGAIDEVNLWSRVLSGAEILQIYNGGAGTQYPFLFFNDSETVSSTDSFLGIVNQFLSVSDTVASTDTFSSRWGWYKTPKSASGSWTFTPKS